MSQLPETSVEFPRTLYMSRGVPPGLTGVSTVTRNLAQHFSRDELILLGYYEPGRPSFEWRKEWPRIIYGGIFLVNARGERWLRRIQFPFLVIIALCLVIFGRCKVILVTYPDALFVLAGYLVAVLTGRPLYAYFHNTYLENHSRSPLARWLQPRVFARACHVFVMSEGMQRLYTQNYPDLQVSPLRHTFNEVLSVPQILPQIHTPLQLVFMGNVNTSCLDALERVRDVVVAEEDLHFTLLTASSREGLEKRGFRGERFSIMTPSDHELLPRLQEGDILILPHGFFSYFVDDELKTIFPTKTIHYLLSQRPILAFVLKGTFIAEFLQEHDCALVVTDPEPPALRNAINRLKNDPPLRKRLVNNALRSAEQFHALRVVSHLRHVIADTHVSCDWSIR